MRNAIVHVGILATLLWGLLRTDIDAYAADACTGLEDDVIVAGPSALPLGLIYRRALLDDDVLEAPTAVLEHVVVGGRGTRPGGGIVLEAESGGRLRVVPHSPAPIAAATRMRLVLATDAATRLEIELHDPVVGTRLYRHVDVPEGEQTIDVRMVDLRYDRGVIPRADRADSWGVRFVDGGAIELRAFELWRDDDLGPAERELAALRDDFDDPAAVTTYRRGAFALLSDAPRLDPEAVFDALDRMHGSVRTLLPSMPFAHRPTPLLVFADATEYGRFWRRFSARVGADIRPLEHDEGLTWQGVATASWSDEYPRVRPTFVHEAHHALLERSYGLSAGRSWLFEGLAILEQLEISAQDLRPVYRRGLHRRDASAELGALTDGTPIDTRGYWQAAMLAHWLTADPGRRAATDAMLLEMAARGDTDLRPIVDRYFGVEFAALSVDFWSWAWLAHGA